MLLLVLFVLLLCCGVAGVVDAAVAVAVAAVC